MQAQEATSQQRKAAPVPTKPERLIEDHALIGDLHTAALVAKDGSLDFLCLPDFDSEATFAALLGTAENGYWKIAPVAPVRSVRRQYRGKTLILETEMTTAEGTIRLVDFMPVRHGAPHVVRLVEGMSGKVRVKFDLRPRFASGYTTPRLASSDHTSSAIAGPDALYLRGGAGEGPLPFDTELTVEPGERIPFVLSWAPSFEDIPAPIDALAALEETTAYWEDWASQIRPAAGAEDVVIRSLITLKACSYRPSGAIVAAPTFGLPETPGGERNWDYRFCWIRDASLTLHAFLRGGLVEETKSFGEWLLRAVGGAPEQLQIMYGIRGERRLTEVELPWLQGYGGAKPVRIGNGAYDQFQLDVLGEFAAVLFVFGKVTGNLGPRAAAALHVVAKQVADRWRDNDHGIWEMRGPTRPFTASKVSAWAVVDRLVRGIDEFGMDIDKAPWVALRKTIFDEICEKGYDAKRNTFTQYYGSKALDASLLAIPLLGFLPATDPRVVGTVAQMEKELLQDGLVLRYRTDASDDGLEGEEGVFLACSFWLANTYHLMGRHDDARKLFERVSGLCNDVGLLAEEYLPHARQQIGNFPQAFSHLALVNSAYTLCEGMAPAERV